MMINLIYYSMYQVKYNKYINKLNKIQLGGKLPIVGFHSLPGGRSYQEDRLSVLNTTAPVPEPQVAEAQVAEAQVAEAQVAEAQVAEAQVAEAPASVPVPEPAAPEAPKQVTVEAFKEYSILSVFDGHGDSAATSDYLVRTLPNRCKARIDKLPDLKNPASIADILLYEFLIIDEEQSAPMRQQTTGSTGVVCVITNDHIIVANIADSPAILFTKTGVKLNETINHNCNNPTELTRVNADHNYPLCLPVNPFNPYRRLKASASNKGLDMTRAFGDNMFKPKANAFAQTYIWDRVPEQILCVCSDSFFERKLDGSKFDQNEQDIVNEVLPVLIANNFDPQVSATQIVATRSNTIKGDNTSMILAIL
jgi:serine/threonine protein phosphatase PrpC